MLTQNGLMDDSGLSKFNLSLPEKLTKEFYSVAAAGKRGKKQQALTAAVLMFLEAGEKVVEQYVKRVGAAWATGNFDELVEEARKARGGGEPRYAALVHLEKPKPPASQTGAEAASRRSRTAKRG